MPANPASAPGSTHPAGPAGPSGPVGLLVNPMAGRDVRRLMGRASSETPEHKRNTLQRAVVGAAASGATRFLWVRDLFRTSERALEHLKLGGVSMECLDIGKIETTRDDTVRAVHAMRDAGCRALLVLGGDGTNRIVANAWPDVTMVPLSTGTNNVFPEHVEATLAGSAAGLVASGRIPAEEVTVASKLVRVRTADGSESLAVIDVVLVKDDHPGSLLPFEPAKIRRIVLSRAEPDAVGMSPLGGLLLPSRKEDDFGVVVDCTAPGDGGRPLLAPISPGLYRTAHVQDVHRLELGVGVKLEGPGLLEFDGDREIVLAEGEVAEARIVRDGPRVIEVAKTLRLAAERGLYLDRPHWHDEGDPTRAGVDCC
jgi:hypothetical protein